MNYSSAPHSPTLGLITLPRVWRKCSLVFGVPQSDGLAWLISAERFIDMPSFDIVSEVDKQELDNALNQARKELATRFDLKDAKTEIVHEKDQIVLTADDANHLRGLREIVIGKLSKRGVDLRNIKQEEPALSSVGHARQEIKIQQGLEGDKAKEIILAIKGGGFKVQSQLQDRQIRVTGKKKDDLQAVIQFVRGRDFGVATNFKNFRD